MFWLPADCPLPKDTVKFQMLSHERRFIFIHIQKTGGTSIEKCFVSNADRKDVPGKHAAIRYYAQHEPDAFENYFKFSVVRNTWDWLVSRYFWSRDSQKIIHCSFDEYLKRVIRDQPINKQEPWLNDALEPQLDRLTIKRKVAVDFIGRYESLQKDFDFICDRVGIRQTRLPHVFKTDRAHYTTYYNNDTRDQVREKYARDINHFGFVFGE